MRLATEQTYDAAIDGDIDIRWNWEYNSDHFLVVYEYRELTGDEPEVYTWEFERDETEWQRSILQVKDEEIDGTDDSQWTLTYDGDTWPWAFSAEYDIDIDGTINATEFAEYSCDD
jgi:hypothetical protein